MAEQNSSNSSGASSKKYDVFLSFRGKDTRRNFTSHLYEALRRKKVETFIDDQLEKGDEISPTLIKVIEDSAVSVVILSDNYASSKWCLDELSKILECQEVQGQIVIPVFLNIDPSNVRKQTGSYEQVFAKYKGEPRCNKWKAALIEVANIVGHHSQNYSTESECIKGIVEDVLQKLAPRYPNQRKGLVGIEEIYEQIESVQKVRSSEVKTIGIWGMGGIGKTTLATVLYDKLSHEFEGWCFLSNVAEESNKHGVKALRKKLFSELLDNENHGFDNFDMSRLRRKRVLIVLDDVTSSRQLEELWVKFDLLGPGSRIIVTTRDMHILRPCDEIYQVKELNFNHSLHLFCLFAFGEKQPKHGYEDLSRGVISYCKGVPLALKVLGASLCGRSKEAWESKLRKLQKIPNMEIHNILKLSYDGLDHSQQDIFLDIACFLKGWHRNRITSLLEACGLFAASDIEVLLDKALITISDCNHIEMHDLIQEMGREIVRQESIKEPRTRSRLWDNEEVFDVLANNKGTDVVEGIDLDLGKLTQDLCLSPNSFAKMTKLRFLKIHGGHWSKNRFKLNFPQGLSSLPNKLRYLGWDGFSLESLPSNFCAAQLVELHMHNSKLKKLWDGVQNLTNLKEIDLSCSQNLIEIPDLSRAEKIGTINLSGCESLRELHPSMLSRPNLTHLNLSGCRKIEKIDLQLKSLGVLRLDGCLSLKEFSVISEEMTELILSDTAICALPSSIWCNKKLTLLSLSGCTNLRGLPDDIGHLWSLKDLDLSGSNVESLPENIKNLTMLRRLWLDDCRKLMSLRELPPSVSMLSAFNCTSLKTDFTQRLVLQHMLKSRIHPKHFFFPGDHVTEDCRFRTSRSSITISHLSEPDLCGFTYCLILSKGPSSNGCTSCSVYQGDKLVSQQRDNRFMSCKILISDHVVMSYHDISDFDRIREVYDHFSNIMFKFENDQERIKEWGVFPVYASESGLKLFGVGGSTKIKALIESQPRAVGVGGSTNENDEESGKCELLLPTRKRRRTSS